MGVYNGDGGWDGKTQSYDFTIGTSNDKCGVVFNASYTNQDGILSKNRNISKEPIIGEGNAAAAPPCPTAVSSSWRLPLAATRGSAPPAPPAT